MNAENPIWALISTFGLMSLFAVGGAAAAVPEMHRIAVEVHHWMTDKQFTDAYAIAQLSPGPNVLTMPSPASPARWQRRWPCACRPRWLPTMLAGS